MKDLRDIVGYAAYGILGVLILVLAVKTLAPSGEPIAPSCNYCHQFGMIQKPGGLYFYRCPHCIGQEWNLEDQSKYLSPESMMGQLDVE